MRRVFHSNASLVQTSLRKCGGVSTGVNLRMTVNSSSTSSVHQSISGNQFHSSSYLESSKAAKPLAENLFTTPEAAAEAILAAKYNVWGEVQGNNERSGRKWLKQKLRGPQVRGWYGINFRDVFPEYITPMKEEMYEDEQQMHRFGKGGPSSKGGKVKPPKKYMIDSMNFENSVDEILEEVEWDDYTELLTDDEISQKKALLASCSSPEDASIIEDLFIRIAAEREANRDKWETKLTEDEAKSADDGSGEKKRHTTSFKFRDGLADKRLWGQEPSTKTTPESSVDVSAPTEETTTAEYLRFDTDIRGMKQAEIDEVYAKYVAEKAKAEWKSLSDLKESVEYGIFYRDAEKTLIALGLPVSEEGLTQLYMQDEETKTIVLTEVASSPPKKQVAPVENPTIEVVDVESTPTEVDDAQSEEKKE